ncbi:MAG TPA: hypothetical protein VFH87_13010 [Candidatus Udaeobacter sp.]|nr:hypothetical protein [Candidatus Udaeobacter sp.]
MRTISTPKDINAPCTRKQFLIGSSAAAIGLICGRGILQAQSGSSPSASAPPSSTPESPDNVADFPEHHAQFDRARVKRFVIAGHGNLAAVKVMLAEEPKLINGAIDWGNGDFETALGGASHMGRRDIAEYLLEHNARMDIFAATMLGQIDIVTAAVAAFPNIVHVPGPHGIPLIVHAEKGGPVAKTVLEFLQPLVAQQTPRR